MSCSLKKDFEAKEETLSQASNTSLGLSATVGLVWGGEEVGRKKRGMKGRGTGQPGADNEQLRTRLSRLAC